jgi:hypothetical protein
MLAGDAGPGGEMGEGDGVSGIPVRQRKKIARRLGGEGLLPGFIVPTSAFFPLFYSVDPIGQDLSLRFTPPA